MFLSRILIATQYLLLALLLTASAAARPLAPAAVCKTYPSSKLCAAGPPPCTLCHSVAPARNAYGARLSTRMAGENLSTDNGFLTALQRALEATDAEDADGDGASNRAEIDAGAAPGDASIAPKATGCSAREKAAAAKSRWNVCGYDPVHAFRRLRLDFCGQSPTRAETATFATQARDPNQSRQAVAAALSQCLVSKHWMGADGVLWNLANPKIRPIDSVKSGPKAGPVPLADYEFDYNLFTWINTGDRDVRDVLLAQYFVKRESDNPPRLRVLSEEELKAYRSGTGQNVEPSKRAGMITTRWFLTVNTMFTAIPRTTAAQAYRAYLGLDISKMEGLHPAPDQFEDYDRKGVKAPACAACHTTLDPLTLPFTRYNGISRTDFAPKRLANFVRVDGPDVEKAPERGMLFGREVKDLLEWGSVAANSDEFARNVVRDYWKLLIGREPQGAGLKEFDALWRGLKDPALYNYRVEKMLHALILTEAYGAP